MTADTVDTDLACAVADLQHAIHLVGVANRCREDPARADVLAEAQTLIGCASNRLLAPARPDPDPEPGVATITARDLRIGDRLHAGPGKWAVAGIERADVHVAVVLRDLRPTDAPSNWHHGTTHSWPNSRPVHVLTPRPGGEEYALAEAMS